jgi:hypothetical protein
VHWLDPADPGLVDRAAEVVERAAA